MDKTYQAVYHPAGSRFYNATIFLSTITLSIRYLDEHSESTDVYWLAEKIESLEEEAGVFTLTYNNKEGLKDKLRIRDQQLVDAIRKNFSHHRFVGGWKHRVLGNTKSKLVLLASIIVCLGVAGYFWFMPWLGERIAMNISKDWEIGMGQKMHQSVISGYRIDSIRTRFINQYFSRLEYKVNYPIVITVVESKETNAFAVPGGNIVVYQPILEKMTSHEQLAALLSHEASHIELRHSLRNMFRSMARKMFLFLLLGNESGLAGILVDNADNLKGLEYSRSLETEADDHGIQMMKKSRINTQGMLGLMQMLQSETENKEPPGFLSTHPVFTKRIENIRNQTGENRYDKKPGLESLFKSLKSGSEQADW